MLLVAWQTRPSAIVGYTVGAIVETASMVISLYATAQLAAQLARYATGNDASQIWFWLIIDIIAIVMTTLGFWIMQYCQKLLYFSIARWSVKVFMLQISQIDIHDFYDNESRNEINKIGNDYAWKLSDLNWTLLDIVYGLLRFVVIAIVVGQITWWLIPLIALFLLPSLIAQNKMQSIQWFVFNKKGDERHIYWQIDYMIRKAASQLELRSLQTRSYIIKKVDDMNMRFYKEQEREYKHANRYVVPSKLTEVGGTVIGSIVLIRQFLAGSIKLEDYLFLSGGLLRIGGALNNVFGSVTRAQEPLLYAHSFFSFMERKPVIVDKPAATNLKDQPITITFENVSFHYPEQEHYVFKNLNLTIEANQHVALVGENGAGKSTLIKLLLRFYTPTDGRILVNGIDLNDIAIETWYDKVATLFQDFNRYPFSIKENIEIAGKKKTPALLKESGEFSGVDTMVKDYKHGWDTVLDSSFSKGIEPSGGQWQRVALARAFYRDARMLILDEPTAAIDARAEYTIFNNIFDKYQDRTALIISHRFSTVRRAHRIIVLEDGKIIEEGSHAKLMKNKNRYYELFTKQAEGYK